MAAELIASGSTYRRCELPIMQGTIRAGVSRITLLADITIVHQGLSKRLRTEQCWVWDMGCDLTLCHATLKEEGLYPPCAGPTDDILLNQFITASGPYRSGEGEELLLSHLRERSSRINAASLALVAHVRSQPKPETTPLSQHEQDEHAEEVYRDFANMRRQQAELSSDGSTSCARFDGLRFEEILELRRSLLRQLRTPVEDVRRRLEEIKKLYPEAFGEDISTPCSLRKFEIKLKEGFRYICFLPRRVSEPVLEQMKAQIAELLRMGVIEESRDSPFSFPIVMAKKPGTTKLRLCVDFSTQNEQTIPLPFTIPEAREQLDNLAGKSFFCSLDCSSFFHQFEIKEEDRDYTAFVVPWGMKYRWKRAPFGLRNCPAHCQKEFQQLLASNGLADIVPYFDDVCFGSNSAEELCEKFEKLLQVAVSAGLKFKESKCVLGMSAIAHLGFVCDKSGIYIHPDRVTKLLKLPAAKDVDHLRQILGAFTYVRGWLKNAATLSAPLTDLLKDAGWEWGPAQEEALRALKEASVLAPCLQGTIDMNKEVFVAVDSCLIGVAACLFQYHDSGTVDSEGKPVLLPKPIMYASRRFSDTEFRWTMNSKEAYGIKFAFERFGNLLLGHKVTVLTDHKNSLWMRNSGEPKVQRWRLYLSRWDYKIGFIDGVQNTVADTLSRLHAQNIFEQAPSVARARIERDDEYGADEQGMEVTDADVSAALFNSVIEHNLHELGLTPECLARERERFESIIKDADTPTNSRDADTARANPISGGIEGEGVEPPAVAPAPPPLEFNEINDDRTTFRLLSHLKRVHNSDCGHFGSFVTYRRLLSLLDDNFDMTPSEIREEVTRYINACPECQKSDASPSPWQSQRFIRKRPFKEISIDVCVMPTQDISGARKCFTVLCSFSRAIELFPLEFADGPRVAECLYWVRNRYGPFDTIRIDRAKAFIQSVVPLYTRLCGTTLHPCTAYAHWQNGQVERSHRSVLRHLRHLISDDAAGSNSQLSWSTLLSGARRIMMNTTCTSTGETPNAFVYGGFCDTDVDMFMSPDSSDIQPNEKTSDPQKFVKELQDEQLRLVTRAHEYQNRLLERAWVKSQENAVHLPEGTVVISYRRGMPHGRPRSKLQYPYSGPWRVIDRGTDDAHPRVSCMHCSSKIVEDFGIHELRVLNLDLLDSEEDLEKAAERDDWDYTLDSIIDHKPKGQRKKKAKSQYQFLVKYKYIPESQEPGQENPCWQPYSSVAHTEALQRYCEIPEVLDQLGPRFFEPE